MTDAPQRGEKRQIARHEAAHVVAALSMNIEVNFLRLQWMRVKWEGGSDFGNDSDNETTDPARLHAFLVIAAAGPLEDDQQVAGHDLWSCPECKHDRDAFAADAECLGIPTDDVREHAEITIFPLARAILDARSKEIEVIADQLVERHNLVGEQIAEILRIAAEHSANTSD